MATATQTYDRTAQDLGNILMLEHVNVCVPDQQQAVAFYILGMGFTRDPYISVGLDNIWVNIGRQQIHTPTRPQGQRLRGRIHVAVPSLAGLRQRLETAAPHLKGTEFAWEEADGALEVTCPWGNRFACSEPQPGGAALGISCVELDAPRGSAEGIARFYRQVMRAPASVENGAAVAQVGQGQTLRFTERDETPPYDGHHVAVYVANFSGPHADLERHGAITEESNEHQYRFVNIFDPDSGETLFELEHEVRSATHPMFMRALVNRDAAVTQATYARDGEALRVG